MQNEYQKEYYRERYAWRKKHKICTYCGKAKAEEGRVLCSTCKAKGQEWSRKYYHNLPADQKQEHLAKLKAARLARKATGLCASCDEPIFRNIYCEEHYKKFREAQNRSSRKYKAKKRGERND
jgi:hypothetical protein